MRLELPKEKGITIHFVNKQYDKSDIIFQAKCNVLPNDTPEDIVKKVHKLDYEHFPIVIKKLFSN
ncbi:MAG: hypothetical protein KOO66_01170 [Bacteroidales bacterium]|nr:hypothetical protein [Bacteroidales bacterium]